MVPSDSSVNWSSLAEGIGDLLRAIGIGSNDGFLRALRYAETQSSGSGAAVGEGQLVPGRVDGGSPKLVPAAAGGLRGRVIHLGARVGGGEGLESGNDFQILLLAAEVRGGRAAVVLVHVRRQRRVLSLRLAVGVAHHRQRRIAEKILQLRHHRRRRMRRRVAEILRGVHVARQKKRRLRHAVLSLVPPTYKK